MGDGSILIRLDGQPRAWRRSRHNGKRHFTDPAMAAYERAIAWEARSAMKGRGILTGPIKLRAYAEFEIPKSWPKAKRETALAGNVPHVNVPDMDNIIKCKDALNGIVWNDDRQVVHIIAWKKYGPEPHVKFVVSAINGEGE